MTDIEFDRVSLAMTLLHHNLLLFIARVSFAVTASILVLIDINGHWRLLFTPESNPNKNTSSKCSFTIIRSVEQRSRSTVLLHDHLYDQ